MDEKIKDKLDEVTRNKAEAMKIMEETAKEQVKEEKIKADMQKAQKEAMAKKPAVPALTHDEAILIYNMCLNVDPIKLMGAVQDLVAKLQIYIGESNRHVTAQKESENGDA